jgi:hypothetical protein
VAELPGSLGSLNPYVLRPIAHGRDYRVWREDGAIGFPRKGQNGTAASYPNGDCGNVAAPCSNITRQAGRYNPGRQLVGGDRD